MPFDHWMNQEDDEFAEIERKRRENVQMQINSLVNRRKLLNQKIIYELEQLRNQNNEIEKMLFQSHVQNENNQPKYNTEQNLDLEIKPDISRPLNVEIVQNEPSLYQFDSGIDIDQTQNQIEYQKKEMNIQISDFYLKNYVFTQLYVNTEKKLLEEKSNMPAVNQFKTKLMVNKRIGQITTDTQHLSQILNLFKENRSLISTELIVLKIIQQAKIQVTNCFESYKSYGLLLAELYTPELHTLLLMSLIHRKETGNTLRSIYSPYFELLRLRNMMVESYNFFASILNEPPHFNIYFVIESYLLILGDGMLRFYGKRFKAILNFILRIYLPMGQNEPSSVRIQTIIKRIAFV